VLRRRPPCRNFGSDPRSKELARQIVSRAARISALHHEQLADIAEFDRAEGWRGDGAVSMVAWVTGHCGVSTSTARQWVRSASNIESLPSLAEGLASGELSLDKLEPLAEVASPETEAALREAASEWSVRQARELATWHRAQKEAEEAEATALSPASNGLPDAAVREFENRTLRFNDTRRSIWVAFTKDDYAVAKSALVGRVSAEMRNQKRTTAGSDPLAYVSFDQRLYDALMHLFSVGSSPATGRRRAFRPRVVVHAPLELLLGLGGKRKGSGGGRGVGVAEIAGVGPISSEVARRLACDADVVLSVEARDGSILDQGRARRDPTTAQRIEIDRRDKGCRFPGCLYTEFTDVHHMRHWTKGGETNLDNLITLCSRHHDAVHELGWTMAGDANAVVTFTSPQGRAMRSVPSPTWRQPPMAPPTAGKPARSASSVRSKKSMHREGSEGSAGSPDDRSPRDPPLRR
jgi:hypothetical protein